jgi:hypothetical protein
MIRNMALVLILGQMVVVTLANGPMGNRMVRVNTYSLMELREKVTGKMEKELAGKMKLNNHLLQDEK